MTSVIVTLAAMLPVLAPVLAPVQAAAQTPANLLALRGLLPMSQLAGTEAGRAALAGNFAVTGSIQNGSPAHPTLLPLPEQRQQAMRDAFITGGNAAGLADGLGTKLGAAYTAKASYSDEKTFSSLSPAVADLIAYTNEVTARDSNAGKYFFANGTTDGKTQASVPAAALLRDAHGATDVFGRAYARPAGSPGAGRHGNARPFQTLPSFTAVAGADYFGKPMDSTELLRGPASDLTDNPSFPSGHTTNGTMESLLLAILVPERYGQMMVRAAEYGDDRIILGAHYAMDVIAGRTLALHDVAHLLANDPAFIGQSGGRAPAITDYPAAVRAARTDMQAALQAGCGAALAGCAAEDTSRFADAAAVEAFYAGTLTYGLPPVHANTAGTVEDVARLAPEAGHLLTIAFPHLTLDQANAILTATEGPGGGFLDDGSSFGIYSRLNLYAAARQAAATAPR